VTPRSSDAHPVVEPVVTDAPRTCVARVRPGDVPAAAVTVLADQARPTAPDGRMLDLGLAPRGWPSRVPGGPS